ncbi:hypothetical protein Tco_0107593 [Tanacetum coccineum]
MQVTRDRQKSYADLKCKPMEFQVGDKVMLKVSPWKGVVCFGKQGKLNPRYVGPFNVLEKVPEKVRSVAYNHSGRAEEPGSLCFRKRLDPLRTTIPEELRNRVH